MTSWKHEGFTNVVSNKEQPNKVIEVTNYFKG